VEVGEFCFLSVVESFGMEIGVEKTLVPSLECSGASRCGGSGGGRHCWDEEKTKRKARERGGREGEGAWEVGRRYVGLVLTVPRRTGRLERRERRQEMRGTS
jgi:hypothetical protein